MKEERIKQKKNRYLNNICLYIGKYIKCLQYISKTFIKLILTLKISMEKKETAETAKQIKTNDMSDPCGIFGHFAFPFVDQRPFPFSGAELDGRDVSVI
jgi:hypothetical protein